MTLSSSDGPIKVACISNDPKVVADHQRSRAADFESEYPLSVGKCYIVAGMSICENAFLYLVRDDGGMPCFAPAAFFELTKTSMPNDWCFALKSGVRASGRDLWSYPVVAIWGYPELVEDDGHAAALEELEPTALEIFNRYLSQAEEIE